MEELAEYVSLMQKLFVVRDVVLKVNRQYILSAGQAAEYRTEPPFLLQGSYRNMNRIAAKVLPLMNDAELWTQIFSAYEQDAQTLTASAEANLLKFKELVARQTASDTRRWDEIKKTFNRNQLLGQQSDDKVGMIIRQLNAFGENLEGIKDVLAGGVTKLDGPRDAGGSCVREQAQQIVQQVAGLAGAMASIREALETGLKTLATAQQPTRRKPAHDEGQEPAAWRNTLQAAIGGVNDKLQTLIQAVREQAPPPPRRHKARPPTRTSTRSSACWTSSSRRCRCGWRPWSRARKAAASTSSNSSTASNRWSAATTA